MTIPVGVTARNEAKNMAALLNSLRAAIAHAESQLPGIHFAIYVLLNDNADHTESVLKGQADLTIWHTRGGIVEAQRALSKTATASQFLVFSDADIHIERDALLAITRVMLNEPQVEVAYAEKDPIEPLRSTPLARALYLYNLREGYQTARHYFNGQFFAIRRWHIPTAGELQWEAVRDNRFLNLGAGIRCDDIYLSRMLLAERGPGALRCVTEARIRYRPPETLRGMFRKYQRMVLELERMDAFFPATQQAHARFGRRRLDRSRLHAAPLGERMYYCLFQLALYVCKVAYSLQRLYYVHWSKTPCPTWLPVEETKEPHA